MGKVFKLLKKSFFLLGVLLVCFMGVGSIFNPDLSSNIYMILLLMTLGFFVGIFNIQKHEIVGFMVAVVMLVLADALVIFGDQKLLTLFNMLVPYFGMILSELLNKLVIFTAPAAIVVGLRAIWEFAKEE